MKTFREACRENTGQHFLDSGGAYGRHHENPPIPKDSPVVSWRRGDSPTIHTGAWLDSLMGVDHEHVEQFMEWQENQDGSWFELGEAYMREHFPDWKCLARDNVYNNESDLDQVYVWEVWGRPGSDWAYLDPDESMVVIYMHTGCDVRGGYGRPMFCHASSGGDYVMPLNFVCGFYPVEARKLTGLRGAVEPWQVPGIDQLSPGYSSCPYGELERFADRIFWLTLTPETQTLIVKHGDYLVKLAPEAPGL